MRTRHGALALVLFVAMVTGFAAEARSPVRIDPSRTKIGFEIDAVGWPTTRGEFKKFTGKIAVDFDRPERSSVEFSVETDSIDLGSPDMTDFVKGYTMLDVAKKPVITFRSTSVKRTGERTVAVTGDMSFYGTVRPATFDVDVDRGSRQLAFLAKGVIHRSDFGFNSGQPLISDRVTVTIETGGTVE